jgi:hypothetical protein
VQWQNRLDPIQGLDLALSSTHNTIPGATRSCRFEFAVTNRPRDLDPVSFVGAWNFSPDPDGSRDASHDQNRNGRPIFP